jgi:hypothetical protein
MINIKSASRFCKDDISLIENYADAVNSSETWDCHHRLEIDLNLSAQELKDRGLYFNRPYTELIFLTHGEHTRIHNLYQSEHIKYRRIESNRKPEVRQKNSEANKGEKNPMYGKNIKDFMSPEKYEQWRQNQKQKSIKTKGTHRVYHEDGTYHYEK